MAVRPSLVIRPAGDTVRGTRPRRCESLSGRPNVMSLVCFRLHPYGRGTTSAPPGSYFGRQTLLFQLSFSPLDVSYY